MQLQEKPNRVIGCSGGVAQTAQTKGNRLFTTFFTDFSYDISGLISDDVINLTHARYASTPALMTRAAEIAQISGVSEGVVTLELHNRFAQALMCVVAALIGFATLLLGTYSRFGVWRQALVAFLMLVLLEGLRGVVSEPVLENARLWPLLYLPTVLGTAVSALFLRFASRPLPSLMPWRRTAAEGVTP